MLSSNIPKKNLPIHFFTIVLNGMPFLRHHIEVFRKLPMMWHWHIVEGVASLNHDTAWPVEAGGKIDGTFHRQGRSIDGTTAYLETLRREFAGQVHIYRKPEGIFWDGKKEMVSAPLKRIQEKCLLWQVDADELWTVSQIESVWRLFQKNPEKSAASYFCRYFVGPDLVTTTRNTYGNRSEFEWLRTWRYEPGDFWVSHEPPKLCRRNEAGKKVNVARQNPFTQEAMEKEGCVFQHLAYVTPEQLRFKESYYGYAGALSCWENLQAETVFPVLLRNYFPWVKDETWVSTTASQKITPLLSQTATGEWSYSVELKNNKTSEPHTVLTIENVSEVAAKASALTGRLAKKKILVISHERSGTHFLLNTIGLNFNSYNTDVLSLLGTPEGLESIFRSFYGKEEPRLFKSHHAVEFFEPFLDELLQHFHIFYIVRDGRDVMNSCFHYFNVSPAEVFPHFNEVGELLAAPPADYSFHAAYSLKDPENMIQRWKQHVAGWNSVRHKIQWIKYETLKNDPDTVLEQIALALEEPVASKKVRASFRDWNVFARKGWIGDWKNFFTEKDNEYFLQETSELMLELGYEVPVSDQV